jgi:nitrogen regulatory protein PII
MKMIVATIRLNKLQEVKEAMARLGVYEMTIFKVTVSEKNNDESERSCGRGVESNVRDKIRLEIPVIDDLASRVITTIRDAANTGNPGDGVISMYEIVQSVNISTGKEG